MSVYVSMFLRCSGLLLFFCSWRETVAMKPLCKWSKHFHLHHTTMGESAFNSILFLAPFGRYKKLYRKVNSSTRNGTLWWVLSDKSKLKWVSIDSFTSKNSLILNSFVLFLSPCHLISFRAKALIHSELIWNSEEKNRTRSRYSPFIVQCKHDKLFDRPQVA